MPNEDEQKTKHFITMVDNSLYIQTLIVFTVVLAHNGYEEIVRVVHKQVSLVTLHAVSPVFPSQSSLYIGSQIVLLTGARTA